eukprot:XP_019926963.1 PREDICTED: uncharacterized protein LOC109619995 [Crassostrea gigas]
MFDCFHKFIVCNFNAFSDHAPLHIELHISMNNNPCQKLADSLEYSQRKRSSWKVEHLGPCTESIIQNQHRLNDCINIEDISSQTDMDSCINKFNEVFHEIVDPFFEIKEFDTSDCSTRRNQTKQDNVHELYLSTSDKPWFDCKLKSLYKEYIVALRKFNSCKRVVNHQVLICKKRTYKLCEAKCKRQYLLHEGQRLEILKKNNPKQFFAKFKRKSNFKSNVQLSEFFDHFKLTSQSNVTIDNDISIDAEDCIFEELDKDIDVEEIKVVIKKLKKGKSHGDDCLLNEYFIEFEEYLLPILLKLFNCILQTCFFPESWSSSIIVPVFKKGDKSDPNNYRGISLVSNMCKLFTSVLNNRLITWSDENDVITDAQFGFKSKCGTSDAIFALHTLITSSLASNNKKLYCAFIDFKKAFDSVDRSKLWMKLSKIGIQGKLLRVIKGLYKNVKACVTSDGHLSDFF